MVLLRSSLVVVLVVGVVFVQGCIVHTPAATILTIQGDDIYDADVTHGFKTAIVDIEGERLRVLCTGSMSFEDEWQSHIISEPFPAFEPRTVYIEAASHGGAWEEVDACVRLSMQANQMVDHRGSLTLTFRRSLRGMAVDLEGAELVDKDGSVIHVNGMIDADRVDRTRFEEELSYAWFPEVGVGSGEGVDVGGWAVDGGDGDVEEAEVD